MSWPGGAASASYAYDYAGRMWLACEGLTPTACQSLAVANRAIAVPTTPTIAQGALATYAYDGLGRRTDLLRGNGTTSSYGYDSASRLSSLALAMTGGLNNQTWTFSYSPASQQAAAPRFS